MSAMQPVAVYGLQVPPDGFMVESNPGLPASFRITMAAIDPSQEPIGDNAGAPRVTLKIIRSAYRDFDDDDDDEEYSSVKADVELLKRNLGMGIRDIVDGDSDPELVNGGPSDPEKTKKARKEALLKAMQEDDEDDIDIGDIPNGVNGVNKGKAKLIDMDDSELSEDSDDAGVTEFVVCTLDPQHQYQQALDITVVEGEEVYFRAVGTHQIYLTGNFIVPADEIAHSDGESEDEDYFDNGMLGMDEYADDLDISESEDDELDNLADPRITEMGSEDEAPKLVKAKKSKNKRAAEDTDEEDAKVDIDDAIKKILKPADDEAKLSKRQAKKLKNNAGQAVNGAEVEKPEAKKAEKQEAKKDKKDKNAKKDEQSPNGKKVQFAEKLEQGPTGAKAGKTGPRVVNGVTVDDKKPGSGPGAKKGDKVGMRYIGKLDKKDGKVFDSNTKGQPFKFKLGSGEVIKGWDIGVQGMSVGGERRITVPAHLAYGSKSTPGIPSNSTLIFDLKLISIN